jgi:hypothetical protein
MIAFGLTVLGVGWASVHLARLRVALDGVSVALDGAGADPVGAARLLPARVEVVRQELDDLRPLAEPAARLLDRLADVPVVGPPARQAASLWTLADASIASASELTNVVSLLTSGTDAAPVPERLADTAPETVSHLRQARADFERAKMARAALADPVWPLQLVEPYLARWDALVPSAEAGLAATDAVGPALAAILGTDRPTTYLILIQTSDELRATGGFITSIGTVRIEQGRPVAVTFQKVYEAEGVDVGGPPPEGAGADVEPPAPIRELLAADRWALRDANWWADFPSSARTVADFWWMLKGEWVDGVVALDEAALEGLLDATGPVEVAGHGTVTAANVKAQTLREVYQGTSSADWYARQTAFSQALAEALLTAARQLPPERLPVAVERLRHLVARRDLMVVRFDSPGAELLDRLGVDGAVGPDPDDYLYLIESNVSYNKLSPFIRQDLEYAVRLGIDGRPVAARLTVDETNRYQPGSGLAGYPDGYYVGWNPDPATGELVSEPGRYGGYTRLLLPEGSQLLGADGPDRAPTSAEEGGRTAIGWYVGVPMGERRRIEMAWVPGGQPSEAGRYRLLVRRQPGAAAHHLVVRVSLPAGWQAAAASPDPAAVEGNTLVWRTTLDEDYGVDVTLRPE